MRLLLPPILLFLFLGALFLFISSALLWPIPRYTFSSLSNLTNNIIWCNIFQQLSTKQQVFKDPLTLFFFIIHPVCPYYYCLQNDIVEDLYIPKLIDATRHSTIIVKNFAFHLGIGLAFHCQVLYSNMSMLLQSYEHVVTVIWACYYSNMSMLLQ